MAQKQKKPRNEASKVAESSIERALAVLDDCTRQVSTMLGEKYQPKLAAHHAYLTKTIAQTQSELGKQAIRAALATRSSIDDVRNRIAQLSPADRAQLYREAQLTNGQTAKRSGLA